LTIKDEGKHALRKTLQLALARVGQPEDRLESLEVPREYASLQACQAQLFDGSRQTPARELPANRDHGEIFGVSSFMEPV